MEASLQPNPHILYGGVWASPLRDDGMIASRKDYTCTSRRGNFSVPFIFWGSGEGGGRRREDAALLHAWGGNPRDASRHLSVMRVCRHAGSPLQISPNLKLVGSLTFALGMWRRCRARQPHQHGDRGCAGAHGGVLWPVGAVL